MQVDCFASEVFGRNAHPPLILKHRNSKHLGFELPFLKKKPSIELLCLQQ
jgi:hypothetical protein